jgi:hypothetical protein
MEWDIACVTIDKVLEMRAEMRHDELRWLVKNLGTAVGNEVGRHAMIL